MTDSENPQPISLLLASALFASYGLRDLSTARHFYPTAIDVHEANELERTLREVIQTAMKAPENADLRRDYESMPGVDASKEANPMMLIPLILFKTGAFTEPTQDRNLIEQSLKAHVERLRSLAFPHVIESVGRITEIRLSDCRIPDPIDDPSFRAPRRMLRMLSRYWGICRDAILDQTDAKMGFRPYPLLPLITDLRSRMDACFQLLEDQDGATTAQATVHELIDSLIGTDPDELSAVPEWTTAKVAGIDAFVATCRLAVGSGGSPLTPEEEAFLEWAPTLVRQLQDRTKKEWHRVLKRAAAGAQPQSEGGPKPRTILAPLAAAEVRELCDRGEDQSTEFKDSRIEARAVAREVAAMLHNAGGGRILVGVSDDGSVTGCSSTKQVFDQALQNAVRNCIRPAPTITVHEALVEGQRVLVVAVPPWNRQDVYQHDGRVLVRKGTNVFPADPSECRRLHKGQYLSDGAAPRVD